MTLVDLTTQDGVATITLTDPERRNAISQALAAEIVAVCDAVDTDLSIGAAVIRGDGGYFCSGASRDELAEIAQDPYDDAARSALSAIYAAFTRVGALRMPTVAAVRGGAVGAGLNLLLATDISVISDSATLRGFHQLRVHPGGGHLSLMLASIGPRATAAVTIFGEAISGARAAEIGLCWSCVPDEDVDAEADRLARAAAADPWLARTVKSTMAAESGPPAVSWPVALEIERGPQLQSFARRSTHLSLKTPSRTDLQQGQAQ
jgi:enoyl-CoA hydratase